MLIFVDLRASITARSTIIPLSINTFIREGIQQIMKNTNLLSLALADRNRILCAVMEIGVHVIHCLKLRIAVGFNELDFDQYIG